MYRYEIDESNTIRIWKSDIEEAPVIIQESWPDLTPWANKEEAEAWANQWILSIQDSSVEAPADSPTS